MCTCTSGAAPACGTPSNPGSLIQNPGIPNGPNGVCFDASYTQDFGVGTQTYFPPHDITSQLLPVTGTPINVNAGGVGNTVTNTNVWPIPSGVNSITITGTTLQFDHAVAAASQAVTSLNFYNSTTQSFGVQTPLQCGTAAPFTITLTPAQTTVWVSGASHYGISWLYGGLSSGGVHDIGRLDTKVLCAGNPLEPACCPPDPEISQRLTQINATVTAIFNSLGGGALKNYTKSTVHPSLTGSASINVSGLAGIQVVINQQPSAKVQPGNPPYIWDMGWLSILTGDGMIEERRLTRDQQLWFPRLMPLAVQVGFYLNPGVVATITELLPA